MTLQLEDWSKRQKLQSSAVMGLIGGVLLPRVHSSLLYIGIWVLQSAKVAAVAGSQLTWLLVMVPVDLEPSHLPRLRLPRRVPLPFALPVGALHHNPATATDSLSV